MKATRLLFQQHAHVRSILQEIMDGTAELQAFEEQLATSLAAHMAIEQQLFYPAVRELDPELVDESYEEHAIAELELKRCLDALQRPEGLRIRVQVLKELIEHHMHVEETELFPAVDRAMDQQAMDALGDEMVAAFDQIRARGFSAIIPDNYESTSSDEDKRALFDPPAP
jgi:iron-sulfur cluster repair protein YtfE (RIC family)